MPLTSSENMLMIFTKIMYNLQRISLAGFMKSQVDRRSGRPKTLLEKKLDIPWKNLFSIMKNLFPIVKLLSSENIIL